MGQIASSPGHAVLTMMTFPATFPAVVSSVALTACLVGCAAAPATPHFEFVFSEPDAEVATGLDRMLRHGVRTVEAFFGEPFPSSFRVEVFPDREALDRSFPAAWGLSKTQPWMVASGVASDLRILSPRVWQSQASGHDAGDAVHLQGIITHELVHVFHGQNNPTGDFTGLDDMGWFLEGLAVHGSGQLDEGGLAPPSEAIARGLAPKALESAWSGKYRYGVSGSLVRFLDRRLGRKKLFGMLSATSNEELLRLAGMSESELLAAWEDSVRK